MLLINMVLWTALNLALGIEIQGDIIRGLPCIKKLNQLFCRTAGTSYPREKIERFIDDNKAMMRRMYGEFLDNLDFQEVVQSPLRSSRIGRSVNSTLAENSLLPEFNSTKSGKRYKRQTTPGPLPSSDRIDSCESKSEVVSPYWLSNSSGKIRAVVNTKEFSQVVHQEVCTKSSTSRCTGDCGCEQKFKYHRLLAYDPEDDCRGIFMDWFLFPSCCACRCDP